MKQDHHFPVVYFPLAAGQIIAIINVTQAK